MHRVTALELRLGAMQPMPDDSQPLLRDAPTLELEAVAVIVDSGPDAVLVKYEYVVVDAEKQTTRAVISTAVWKWPL